MKEELERLRRYLDARRNLWTQIATDTGVARRAIAYIVDSPGRDPRVSTVSKLLGWVAEHDPGVINAPTERAA